MSDQRPLRFDADPIEFAFGQLDGPVHLPSLTTRERQETMTQLRGWVAGLVRRFGLECRVVPPCWEAHNGMIEALLALRDHERACYADSASPTAAVEWLRALREIELRLVELGGQTQCTVHEHRPNPIQHWATGSPIEQSESEMQENGYPDFDPLARLGSD